MVRLPSEGLLSKWGFGDGDVLDDILEVFGFGDEWKKDDDQPDDKFGFDHRVLIRLVREHLIPAVKLYHEIEVVECHSLHNPIRAQVVDGEHVEWTKNSSIVLWPPHVDVPLEVVAAIAREESGRA